MKFPGTPLALLIAVGCTGDVAPPEPPETSAPERTGAAVPVAPRTDSRLHDDVGGWTPPDELLDAALALGDRPDRTAAIAALDAATPARRIDVLRAGLRLRDRPAAIACAARLTYREMDRWECARAVDLLTPEVFRPGTEASFDEFRSYLGSVELARVLRSLPPPPWDTETVWTFAQFHRVARAEHLPIYAAIARSPVPVVSETARSDLLNLRRWNDEHREEVACAALGVDPASLPPPREDSGLPSALTALLARHRKGEDIPPARDLAWLLRWCHDVRPGPDDEELLLDLAEHCGDGDGTLGGTARLLLGRIHGLISEAWLRRDRGSRLLRFALARRRSAATPRQFRELFEDAWDKPDELALAMELFPEHAAQFLEHKLLGADDWTAMRTLLDLSEFAVPGAQSEMFGLDWRRTSLDGIATAARELAARGQLGGLRAAMLGAMFPGCRTRRLAEIAAADFRPDWLGEHRFGDHRVPLDEILAFLETGAPDTYRARLRHFAADLASPREEEARLLVAGDYAVRGEQRAELLDLLLTLGDPASGPALVEHLRAKGEVPLEIARSPCAEVRAYVEGSVREQVAAGVPANEIVGVGALAALHGLPESVASDLAGASAVPGVVEAVLAGRPQDALALVLAAHPDEPYFDVGLVDDSRVRAYLTRLRERRDLRQYWYATGELAVLGDPAARAEFWGAMQDGRYRVTDEVGIVPRTLGLDLPATMPFWIDELRSQCCRVSNGLQGDIVDDVLGIEGDDTSGRTPYERAKELWDSAGGRFVWSRHLERFVPEPR